MPRGGLIKRVTVYPSDFGLQRMQEEEQYGPRAAFAGEEGDDDDEDRHGCPKPREDSTNVQSLPNIPPSRSDKEKELQRVETLRAYERDRLRHAFNARRLASGRSE